MWSWEYVVDSAAKFLGTFFPREYEDMRDEGPAKKRDLTYSVLKRVVCEMPLRSISLS